MTTYTLQVDLRGPFSQSVRHVYKNVERQWPSAPRIGDTVVLDDSTGWGQTCGAVAFHEDAVTLHFFDCTEEDLHSLTMAGFTSRLPD